MATAMVRRAILVTEAFSKSGVTSRSSTMGCNYQSRRWFLPPQLKDTAANYLSIVADWATPGIYPVPDAEGDPQAVRFAKFAIEAQNKASASQGNLRFMRVLKARSGHSRYYVVFEALRGKADVDVYCAEVAHSKGSHKATTQLELIRWQLLNDSISYPHDIFSYASGDYIKMHHTQSVSCETLKAENFLPKDLEMDIRPANGIFDINTFENFSEYALFAVTTRNKNEGDKVHLKNIVWACKSKLHDNWVYRLVLEAIHGKKELTYYAIVKASGDTCLELMGWYMIPRTFFHSDLEKVAEQNPAIKFRERDGTNDMPPSTFFNNGSN